MGTAYRNTHKNAKADVVVIGGAAAGLTAAIEAAKYGVDVVLLDKGRVGFSGSTPTSDGETSAVFHPEDSKEIFLKETIEGGELLNVSELAETVIEEGNYAVEKLGIFGVPVARNSKGEIKLYQELGQKMPRTPSVHGGGPAFSTALRKEALHRGVRFLENTAGYELLLDDKAVAGCIAIDAASGESFNIRSKAVVLAAGGATDLYPYATASYLTTGDGYWLGWTAGLEFSNMEFVEFSVMPAPDGIPLSSGGIKPLTGRGAKFYNASGERFMEKHDPERKELVKRSRLVYGLYKEIKEGRGPVYMDATMIPDEEYDALEQVHHLGILERLRSSGVNYRKERFQWISPAVHTFLGGLRINKNTQTPIAGLYGAGENIGGEYGADRVGTYLTACAVLGFKAGMNAAKYAINTELKALPQEMLESKIQQLQIFGKEREGTPPEELRKRIKDIAGEHIACERSGRGLMEASDSFREILEEGVYRARVKRPNDLIRTIEIRNLALTGRLIAEAGLRREETRGQHRRVDFPERNDTSWLKWIILKNEGPSVADIAVREEELSTGEA